MHRGLLRLAVTVVALGIGAVVTGGVAAADSTLPALELHLDSLAGGTTPDSSPNDLSATAQGTALADGRFGNALRLSAVGDAVSVPDNAVLAPAQVTVMAWVRQPSFDSAHYDGLIVGKPYATAGCHTDSYALTEGLSTGVRFAVDVSTRQYSTPDSSNSSVWDGQWHAIAGTFDGSTISLYQDGTLVSSTATDGSPLIYDTDPSEFGFSGVYAGLPPNPASCTFAQKYAGDIDEIRVYDRALSAQEIADVQNPTATTPPEVTDPPTVVAAPADGLSTQGATLHGTVTPNGSTVSDCHFEYGTSTAYGSSVPCAQSVGGGTTGVSVSATVSGLTPNTTYDFKLVATNGVATASDTGMFSTTMRTIQPTSPPPPVIGHQTPTVTSSTTASFSGLVNPEGSSTSAHFEYGLDPGYYGGGAIVYNQTTPARTVGFDSTSHAVTARVSGLLPDAVYHVRLVASSSAGAAQGPDLTFITPTGPAPPPPTLGQTADITVISGIVLIKPPHGRTFHAVPGAVTGPTVSKGLGFVPLTQARQVPIGSQIDALRGTLELVVASAQRHHTQRARLAGGLYTISQTSTGPEKALTTLALDEGAFAGAPSYASCKTKSSARTALDRPHSSKPKLSSQILQTLSASDNHGKFRTKGRYSAATVRGTQWTTQDRCDGTLTKVRRGVVNVLNFATRQTITLHAGQSYLAKAQAIRAHNNPRVTRG
jgi:Concanavalin A-like lectin/glucanases superfamily